MSQQSDDKEVLLEVKNLKTYFTDRENNVWKILDGIDLKVYRGSTLGIMGPSGVGKSVLARSILRLVDYPGKIEGGQVLYRGKDLLITSEEIFNEIRGREISLVVQHSDGGIDPLRDITFATSEPYRAHSEEEHVKTEIRELVISQLGQVAIPDPTKASDKYAHQLSGGETQRVKIASALFNNPSLLIADEPVSNLDATVAKQILDLLYEMKIKFKLSIILIAHNLGVLAQMSDYVAIMYAGKIVEIGEVEEIFYNCRHPFTQGLFYATPSMAPRGKLKPIPGEVPDPRNYPQGCHFHPRCEYCIDKCLTDSPELMEYYGDHLVACWRKDDIPKYIKQE
ncbi:MAG: ABC transporter ATP-binding protein [Candidatus Heimdallarchaeota archaeon]|nr:ABC transporter ATP-binding protein [Candidatus Heimdallarchaeota archaeon]